MERGVFFKSLVIILVFLMCLSFAYAENHTSSDEEDSSSDQDSSTGSRFRVQSSGFSQDKSYKWLYDKVSNTSSLSVDEMSLSTIALMQKGDINVQGMIERIESNRDSDGCWPAGNCNVKDTSLATLTLALAGRNVSEEVNWLRSSRVAMPPTGDWWIVVKGNNGTCEVNYGGTRTKTYTIEGDKIKSTGGRSGYYISLNELSRNLVRTEVQPNIGIS